MPLALVVTKGWNSLSRTSLERPGPVSATLTLIALGADSERCRRSFGKFEQLLTDLASGTYGRPPASVTVISGDIHHSYLATVGFPAGTNPRSAVYQAVCSPIHNVLPDSFRRAQQLATSRVGELASGALARLAGVRKPRITWRITRGPWFLNMLSALEFDGRRARIRFDRTVTDPAGAPHLQSVCEADLS